MIHRIHLEGKRGNKKRGLQWVTSTYTKTRITNITANLGEYTPENQHDIGKSPFPIGNTSSNGGFSIVMLVFGGVLRHFACVFGIVWSSQGLLCLQLHGLNGVQNLSVSHCLAQWSIHTVHPTKKLQGSPSFEGWLKLIDTCARVYTPIISI